MCLWIVAYWLLALASSGLLGYYALDIHQVVGRDDLPDSARWQQRWLNFVGALVGWSVLWPLIRKYGPCLLADGRPSGAAPDGWAAFAGLIAFLGITGYLPGSIILPIQGAAGVLFKWLKS